MRTGAALGWLGGLLRTLSGAAGIAALCLGILAMWRDAGHRAWHDKIAGTIVVQV